MAAAIGASLAVIREEPERRARLHALASHLRAQLRARGLDVASGPSQIVPIHIGDNEAAVSIADAMQADGFDVRAIRPPSVAPGHARLRVSVNTRLGEATLDRFVERLTKALQEAGLCSAVSS
jgi:8-amino-7-oxononanoate synthase